MVSVVIPAYNEEDNITKCLQALVGQETEEKFEVILVNNNSTDKTEEIAKTFLAKLNLKILLEKQKGRGIARHMGFMKANSNIILSTDSDAHVPKNWIDTLVANLKKNGVVAVTGTCRISDCSKTTNNSFNFFQPLFMKGYRLVFKHYWLSGFSFAIYKNIYQKSGGFNTKLNAQEDIDLSFKVAKLGKIHFISNLPVTFSGRRFKDGLIKGLIPYIVTFFEYFLFKKKNMELSDIR